MAAFYRIVFMVMLSCVPLSASIAFDPPLSSSEVAGIRNASRDMAGVMKDHQAEFERLGRSHSQQVQDGADPCTVPPDATSGPGFQKMLAIAKKNGFSSGEQYCRSNLRVIAACGAVRAEKEDPNWRQRLAERGPAAEQARAQMEQARQQIEASPNLSAEQKAQMLSRMSAAMESLAGSAGNPILTLMEDASPQDMQTAAPACAELEQSYKNSGAAQGG
ncbi:MAG: hypothetical protein H6905_06605 [Hyphomicrobiales bacterium]|nr:hypothetical protein [Hyphomicrobiales bacterium]